jgi:hypothetical protein
MPRVVRILSQKVAVLRSNAITHDDYGNCHGIFYPATRNIEVVAGLSPDYEREVFLHENLHAIFSVSTLDRLMPRLDEEKLVNSLSPFLLTWLRENRGAVAYLQERA